MEFIEDHSEAELEACINEAAPLTGEWRIYLNSPPSEAVKRDLSTILRLMAHRTVEDGLREEYFVLLRDARRVMEELEAEVRHCLIPLSSKLERYERFPRSSS